MPNEDASPAGAPAPADVEAVDAHMAEMQAVRPTKKWRRRTLELLERPGVREHVLATVRGYARGDRAAPCEWGPPDLKTLVADREARGYVWAAALSGDPAAFTELVAVFRHAAWLSREYFADEKLANATVNALGACDHPEVMSTLRALAEQVGYPGGRKQVANAVRAAAERQGLTPRQLTERTVPDHGLGADGSAARELGGHRGVVAVEDPRTVRLTFVDAAGRALRTVPAALKEPFADEIDKLKDLAKQVRGTLASERARIEALMSAEATWTYGEWCRHYRDHPITGAVTSGLIWEFQHPDGTWTAAAPAGSALVTADGHALPEPGEAAGVRLWHPLRAPAAQVRAWRAFVTDNRMVQPFKQAFRETYRLTPAEEETGVYSNRFAAHIVRYDQLYALFKQRGWTANYLGPYYNGYAGEAKWVLAEGEWRVRFFHEAVESQSAGAPEYASTDQVRFDRRAGRAWREVPLAEVPPAVFSEAMRDVDLFVSVTSVAADPDWIDRGEDRFAGYWRQAGFGELTASAETRRDALARILPRTKIADRCALDGRFLVVRGDLRTYKIHLGSANILMEPDDQYLCIVPARTRSRRTVFLPFEDDRLALILSKAFLLAADTAITDPSIMRQIRTATP
ncbi:hypothetical protein Acsp04_26450 [Actinomadura sp. NBRC 104425]|uniref:DUF4132 domain-containing protein n=1 Tax=Actinomadura sp. NBRC 104425 TaxID=3032204 RepID=UPI00249FEAA7|nr:DUF4132 domain-containing protein [Actinomadura sp. NBRC 104425]GLZ12410.1 hypothetical protein Acsp04_26450 [Actinomadura sp. NBRC 104425]